MNSSIPAPTDENPVDPDLVEQAVPGHGIPSQDPNPAAQVALSPEEADRESKSVLMGGGLVAGVAAGAAVGVLVGGTLGAFAGAIGGAGAGELIDPENTTPADDAPKGAEDTLPGIPPR